MTNIIEKVKEAVKPSHGDHSSHDSTTTTTHDFTKSSNYGPHDSNMANAADPRVDSDRSKMTGGANAYDSTKSSNYGPHGSNVANKADPRVDSDLDNTTSTGSGLTGSTTTGTGHSTLGHNTTSAGSGLTGSTTTGAGHSSLGHGSNTAYDSTRSSNYGPHDSNVANKVDPRVDSDLDSSAAYNTTSMGSGLTGSTGHSTLGHNTTSTGSGLTGSTGHSTLGHNTTSTSGLTGSTTGAGHNTLGHSSHPTSTTSGLAGATATGAGLSSMGHGSNTAYDSTRSSNYGPHDSNVANMADPRVDSDRSHMGYGANTSTGSGLAGTTATGAGLSSMGHGSHTTSTGPGLAGTTGSGLSGTTTGTGHNTLGHSSHPTSTTSGLAGTTATGAGLSSMGHGSNTAYDSTRSSNYGPHDSNVANAADPRVDSDRSHMSHSGNTMGTGLAAAGTGAAGYGASHMGSNRSSNHGPHDSNLVNKADPRIDSDRDGRAAYNTTSTGSHLTPTTTGTGHGSIGSHSASTHSPATGPASSTAGPHSSNIANEADPRVDSDLSKEKKVDAGDSRFSNDVSRGSIGGYGVIEGVSGSAGHTTTKNFEQAQKTAGVNPGTGSSYNSSNSKTTAGPHDSNIANKMDPRVDSDLDGSKTIGSTQQRV